MSQPLIPVDHLVCMVENSGELMTDSQKLYRRHLRGMTLL